MTAESYNYFDNLSRCKARLHDNVWLGNGLQLAAWSNRNDRVYQHSDHHTISLYVAHGYQTFHRTLHGWENGGGPDKACLMPEGCDSEWDIRGDLAFVHLYCRNSHLRAVAERVWDKSASGLQLDEKIFFEDGGISRLYRHFLLDCNWRQPANQLQLSSAATLLLTHIVRHYSTVQWRLPRVTGGLSPAALRRTTEWIEANLAQGLSLRDLAEVAGLSEFHFARMFRHSVKMAPHQYVMQRRMARAEQLLAGGDLSLTDIALCCGFSSSSHFSNRVKATYGCTPGQLRAARQGK